MTAPPTPPHDCRLTARCLKSSAFDHLRWPHDKDCATLRTENSIVDTLFEQREHDELGGEGGERIRQVRGRRPVFKVTSGRMRGATWFEKNRPPQGLVWLLAAEWHEEGKKGRADAYDIIGRLSERGELFPEEIDYLRLELDRRRWDLESFTEDLARDADALAAAALPSGAEGTVAGVAVRLVVIEEDTLVCVYGAVSQRPARGTRSGLEFALDTKRFFGVQEGIRGAFEKIHGPPTACDELSDRRAFPGGLRNERPFLLLIER